MATCFVRDCGNMRLGNVLYKTGVALSQYENIVIDARIKERLPLLRQIPYFRNTTYSKFVIGTPLEGYCQDFNLLDIEKVRSVFSTPIEWRDKILVHFPNVSECVVIHIRRGDYIKHINEYAMPSKEWYFEMAEKHYPYKRKIVISDDKELSDTKESTLFDFYLQTLAYANICSASTFSLMGAILNKSERCVVPSPFYGEYWRSRGVTEDLIPKYAIKEEYY